MHSQNIDYSLLVTFSVSTPRTVIKTGFPAIDIVFLSLSIALCWLVLMACNKAHW